MELEIDDQSRDVVIRVRGTITVDAASELREALRGVCLGSPDSITLDLAEVPFIDSSGLGVILGMRKDTNARGITLSLSNPRERVLALLRLTRLAALFGIDQ